MSFPFVQPYFGLGNSLQTAQAGGAGASGGWVELARTTLGSSNANISVASLPDKRYYMILNTVPSKSSAYGGYRFNSDTGGNYAYRTSTNGASDTTATGQTSISDGFYDADPLFRIAYITNLSGKEKLGIEHWISQASAGAGNAPDRQEFAYKYANTSNPIDEVTLHAILGTWGTGSEVVVLGWDPADTHTTNFWEELASVDWSSGGEIDTGTFASKKYLWVQISWQNTTGLWTYMNFNGDNSATKYTSRQSVDGAADGTVVNYSAGEQYYAILGEGSSDVYANNFANMFIVNNATSEKLGIIHSMLVRDGTVGAGYAPRRVEGVFKYTDTSNAITRIQLLKNSGSYSGGTMKVWGSD
jgi:hypothetical protein